MGLFEDIMAVSQTAEKNIVSGIITGVVKENWDKSNPGKVKVELFLGESGKNVTGWVSVMSPYAGKNFGYYSLPEVGSEVVVAFNMGDRNCPVVIGCLWNGNNTLPESTATDKNFIKRFKTKGECEVIINDEKNKQTIEIKTAKKTGVLIDDENQLISVHDDKNKNQIIINSKEGVITIQADKKIVLKAGGSEMAVLDGSGKKATVKTGSVNLEAQNDMKLKAQSFSAEGTTVAVKGTSSLQVQSSGTTQVKGTMVKIN